MLESKEFPTEVSGSMQVNMAAMLLGLTDGETQENGILILFFITAFHQKLLNRVKKHVGSKNTFAW